ncbi:histidine phosphatase family protein [Alcaligenes sp. SDU_A2]|uniref:histidine phosphatase family protein n=1 Tax=Alcaligenes sp. SDU_A2 TaxID=3136634 RepID=UPI002C1B7FAD|nr:histidine phosphatase family protein [Alcaligenes faecalis]
MKQETHIWLIRHGETVWNAARRLQGWQDTALNEVGEQQARDLAGFLASEHFGVQFDHVISSDLQRAAATAAIACAHTGLPVVLDGGFRERGFGVLEGRSWDSFGGRVPDQPSQSVEDSPQGGESILVFQQRVLSAVQALAQRYPGQKLAVFTHGGVIDMVWRRLLRVDLFAPRTQTILNTSINHFSVSPLEQGGEWVLQRWGLASHIDAGALDDLG